MARLLIFSGYKIKGSLSFVLLGFSFPKALGDFFYPMSTPSKCQPIFGVNGGKTTG
jgi:hypothetical protein